ncbi:alpha/beta fold hydrolase [Cypionkella sp.]|uniref:alpha/beta fold hydrolase n=1 Tax=Cypionkella sp. TaxID=2811411 RepID=UPI002ABC33C2|nr:alpha/beta fold hydrolase [Cypionkella sp.]MDZ4392710.1 alpha/beta fold hydrolase [Cypionkella sp.]
MFEVVLVHGACHGAWAWERVIPALAALGLSARAVDLPGRGEATSLGAQVEALVAGLRAPSVLVGHSAGGFAITGAAVSPLVRGLIYVCGYMPEAGRSLAEMRRGWEQRPLDGAFVVDRARGVFGFDPARAKDLFFHDCADESGRLYLEALEPMETALADVTAAKALPRGYIACLDDRAIPPAFQADMARGIAQQAALPCGHSPFLAMPERLAGEIAGMMRGFG